MKDNKIFPAVGGVEDQGGLNCNIIFSGKDSFQCNQTGCTVSGQWLQSCETSKLMENVRKNLIWLILMVGRERS